MNKIKVSMSWSGGKDSAFALYKILQEGSYEVVSLHTVINDGTKRVGMHGVREDLINVQAEKIGIPLVKLYLESSENHVAYEALMRSFYNECVTKGITAIVFGDIFLEDLKKYREDMLMQSGLHSLFPLWKKDSKQLIDDFIDTNFKTLICAANAKFFTENSLGKTIDHPFINALPTNVDPCGEYGEFHTYVYDGPIFNSAVCFRFGEIVSKQYQYQQQNADGSVTHFNSDFLFQDLLPEIN
jgi:uncharacterized protein (TIGR00290 family)